MIRTLYRTYNTCAPFVINSNSAESLATPCENNASRSAANVLINYPIGRRYFRPSSPDTLIASQTTVTDACSCLHIPIPTTRHGHVRTMLWAFAYVCVWLLYVVFSRSDSHQSHDDEKCTPLINILPHWQIWIKNEWMCARVCVGVILF